MHTHTAHNFTRVTVAGRDYWVDPATEKVLPVVCGGSDVPPAPPAPTPPAPAPQLTAEQQAAFDALVQRRLAEDRAARERQLAETLGCTPDEAKAKLAKLDEIEQANKTDLEKAQAAAAAAEARAAAAEAASKQAAHQNRLDVALLAAGYAPDALDRIRAMATGVNADSDAAAITAEVEAIKTIAPPAGATPPPPGAPRPPAPTPATQPAPTTGGTNPARERARRRLGVPDTKAS